MVDTVVEQLHDQIVSERWEVGGRIPTETELTEQLEVSRPSLREAVRSLVQMGLLETRQGDGTYVVARNATEVALRRTVRNADAAEVMTVRRALDVLAAREAALERTEHDLDGLASLLRSRRQAIDDGDLERFVDDDVAFHLGIAAASHNEFLTGIYTSFDASLRQTVLENSSTWNEENPLDTDFHDALLDAIRQGEPAAATTAALTVLDVSERRQDA